MNDGFLFGELKNGMNEYRINLFDLVNDQIRRKPSSSPAPFKVSRGDNHQNSGQHKV